MAAVVLHPTKVPPSFQSVAEAPRRGYIHNMLKSEGRCTDMQQRGRRATLVLGARPGAPTAKGVTHDGQPQDRRRAMCGESCQPPAARGESQPGSKARAGNPGRTLDP